MADSAACALALALARALAHAHAHTPTRPTAVWCLSVLCVGPLWGPPLPQVVGPLRALPSV